MGGKCSIHQIQLFVWVKFGKQVIYSNTLTMILQSKIPNSWTVEVDDQPDAQSIHIEVWAGTTMVVNKTIVDTDTGRLAGGRLGVYCQSQEQVVWAKMSTQCL